MAHVWAVPKAAPGYVELSGSDAASGTVAPGSIGRERGRAAWRRPRGSCSASRAGQPGSKRQSEGRGVCVETGRPDVGLPPPAPRGTMQLALRRHGSPAGTRPLLLGVPGRLLGIDAGRETTGMRGNAEARVERNCGQRKLLPWLASTGPTGTCCEHPVPLDEDLPAGASSAPHASGECGWHLLIALSIPLAPAFSSGLSHFKAFLRAAGGSEPGGCFSSTGLWAGWPLPLCASLPWAGMWGRGGGGRDRLVPPQPGLSHLPLRPRCSTGSPPSARRQRGALQRVAGEQGHSLVMWSGSRASEVGFSQPWSCMLGSAAVRSTEPSSLGWLSPAPGDPAGRTAPGASLCAEMQELFLAAGIPSDVCELPMSECVRVSLTRAGPSCCGGGSGAGRRQAGHTDVPGGLRPV